MMKNNPILLAAIDKIANETLAIIKTAKQIPQINNGQLDSYQHECEQIPIHIHDGCLKIAVVGVIKSGKSTFVNSLVGKELVQRGAGVITSITTRIRKGNKNRVRLFFKSWDQVNAQLQNALQLFPDIKPDIKLSGFNIEGFDIRREEDLKYLEQVYESLIHEFGLAHDEILPETVLIKNALQGFNLCKDQVQADESITCFLSKQFDQHKAYTSDPNRAFYIKDVCLDVYGKAIDPNIEIADCQGADSTDPAQLGQVLNYIESANLIVYCVSSRTGLRQSDIMFLKRIKHLGRIDNIIFVNNCDLSEHESLDDLIKIQTSIQDDLGFLNIAPRIFSFSVLYNLFMSQFPKLKRKDQARLELWQTEKKMVQYCDQNTREFSALFEQVVQKDSYRLLISNHVTRLEMITAQLDMQIKIALDLLSSEKSREDRASQKLEHLYQNASRLKAIVSNSFGGAMTDLVDQVQMNTKKIFEQDNQAILQDTQSFIKTIPIDVEKYRSVVKESGFNKILYLLFQDFKRALDIYVLDSVQPKLNQFIKSQESLITAYFNSLFDSYQIDLIEVDSTFQFESIQKNGQHQDVFTDSIDIEKIIRILGLKSPGTVFKANYTPKIKLNIFTDFGFHTLFDIVKAVFNKQDTISFTPGLNKSVLKIKQESSKRLYRQFKTYQSDVQSNYLTPLIDAAVRDFKEKINQRFNQYDSYKQEMNGYLLLEQSQKEEQKIKILAIKKRIHKVVKEINAIDEILPK